PRHLLFASLMLMVCGVPNEWLMGSLTRQMLIGIGVGIYLLLYIGMSRDPKAGMLGCVLVALAVILGFSQHNGVFHWAVQSGLVFLLLHSLRWEDSEHEGARAVRILAAVLWMAHALIWVHNDVALWIPCIPGALVLAAYLITQIL